MYQRWDFKKEGRIGSFGYTFYPTGGQENCEKIKPKKGKKLVRNGDNFCTNMSFARFRSVPQILVSY